MQLSLFCCLIFVSSAITAQPTVNHPPSFPGGAVQSISVCKNSGPATINSLLAVVDSDAGQTETWTVNSGPAHGALSGLPVSATSTGGLVTPSWLDYTPATGFSGIDSFSIQVSDGAAVALTAIVVTVNPLPTLSSTLTPPAICDGSVFSYTPTSGTPGAVITWHRVFTPGISNPTASGTGNPGETLGNVTNDAVNATYVFTVSANGCSSLANVVVTVLPTPRLSGSLNDTICSGSTFNFTPSSPVAGTTYSWSRAVVAGITPASPSAGTGNITELLTNTTSGALTAIYTFVLTANGCTATRNLSVTVFPQPVAAEITTAGPSVVCSGTQFQNFGAGTLPAAGTTYTWSAVNAGVFATGSTSQYCLINFPAAGNASVTLTVGGGTPCAGASTYTVTVGSDAPAAGTVIYYNYHFVMQDNTQDTYQWGYDDVATLDSTLIPDATFQSYPNATPDFNSNYYWVITTKNGCLQKTYFNGPLTAANVHTADNAPILKIAPNPANNLVNITLGVQPGSRVEAVITDITGQVLKTQSGIGNEMQIDIAGLPPGCYLVSCFENKLKIATSRFIKNQD